MATDALTHDHRDPTERAELDRRAEDVRERGEMSCRFARPGEDPREVGERFCRFVESRTPAFLDKFYVVVGFVPPGWNCPPPRIWRPAASTSMVGRPRPRRRRQRSRSPGRPGDDPDPDPVAAAAAGLEVAA